MFSSRSPNIPFVRSSEPCGAGWRAVLVVRPGNKALPEGHGFPVIESMTQLLAAYQ